MKNIILIITTLSIFLSFTFYNCDTGQSDSGLSKMQQDTFAMAKEAYIAGFPLVIMELTKNQFINPSTPINTLTKNYRLVGPSDTSVVSPNVDNYYAIGFLDLSEGGLRLTMPSTIVNDTSKYFMMPMLDAYTNVFISPGKRTGFTGGGQYVVAGPNDTMIAKYENDPDIDSVFHAPTNLVWILGRFEVDNERDSVTVVGIMDQFELEPYSSTQTIPTNPITDDFTTSKSPNQMVENMPIQTFFRIMGSSLNENPLNPTDNNLLKKLVALGITPDSVSSFELSSFSQELRDSLRNIPAEVFQLLRNEVSNSGTTGWSVNINDKMGNYGKSYLLRAVVAFDGLGANQIEDAIYFTEYYDSEQNYLVGGYGNKYTLTFDSLPPVNAFWSVTLYNKDGNLVANDINRYAIGHDTDHPFHFEADSSLVIYIQPEQPADYLKNNWLPSPKEKGERFNLMLRAYYPKEELLDTLWLPNLVIKQ